MIVDAVSGEVSTLLHVHDVVESVTFAPDCATFVTTGQDGAVYLWDTATQHLLGSITPLGTHRVRASFLAADRVMLVYGTGEILEWDPRPTHGRPTPARSPAAISRKRSGTSCSPARRTA